MRILFIAESFPTSSKVDLTGGVEARDWYVAAALAKRHHVTVVTNARANCPATETMRGIHVVRLGQAVEAKERESAITRLSFVMQCIRTIPSMSFDLIQGSNVVTQYLAAHIGKQMHKPIIALIPDIYIGQWIKNTNLFTGLIGELIEPWVIHASWDTIISWSQATTQKLVSKKVDPKKIITIAGGVDTRLIDQEDIPKRKNLTIITAARLVPYKRIDVLIKAVARLSKKYPQLKLYILGDGPDRSRLEKLAIEYNVDNRVTFMGQVSSYAKVIKLLKSAHLFSLPSEVEGFGLATLEACACGLPFVNLNIPATNELTEGGKGGILIDKPNETELATAIDTLFKNKKLYNTKVRECRSVAKKHDWSVCVRKTEKVFSQIVNQNHQTSHHH